MSLCGLQVVIVWVTSCNRKILQVSVFNIVFVMGFVLQVVIEWITVVIEPVTTCQWLGYRL